LQLNVMEPVIGQAMFESVHILTNACYNLLEKCINGITANKEVNRPGFPGECFICELRLPDHRFRWKHNKLFLLLPEEYGPAF
ncbi:hypothetical protein, partial [Escherichia coli]|uniref:hypothetical protein n=1 Tax=Escherichia coli TaxID=562 RepID=UPI001BC84F72